MAIQPLSAHPAIGDEPVTAREHYRRGTNAFNLGHYLEAVKEYEAAYQQKEDAALLFNIAQAYRLAGENQSAVRVYKSYLHQVPDSGQRSEVEKRIAELETLIEQQRKTQQAPPEGTLPPKPPLPAARATLTPMDAQTPPPVEQRAPWYKDATAMTLAAVGVAGIGAGAGLAVKGNLDLSHAQSAADLQDHDALRRSGATYSIAGYVTLGVGAALCIAAVIKWAVRPHGHLIARAVDVSPSSFSFAGSR